MGKRAIAAESGLDTGGLNSVHGVYLLFAKGERPDMAGIDSFCAAQPHVQISFRPDRSSPLHLVGKDQHDRGKGEGGDLVWLELLREGLTFELKGLSPGTHPKLPQISHKFDCDPSFDRAGFEAVQLATGAHLAGGERSLPIVKGMIALACDLVHHFEQIAAVAWPPAQSAIGRRFFESTTTAWIEGGAFPALGLTAFEPTANGALESVGLSFFIGQELLIEPELARDKVAATRLGVRLVNQLLLIGGIDSAERMIAPDGRRLVLSRSRNGQFVRVRSE